MAHVFKSFGVLNINDDFFMTAVGSMGAVINGLSRSIWSTLQDKYTFKKIFGVLLVCQIILSGTLPSIAQIGDGGVGSKILYMVWI